MKKILFITDRNVLTTSGELRLIKNRAESLYNESNICTDFIVLSKKKRIEKRNETINAGGDFGLHEVAFSNPIKSLKSYCYVRKEIEKKLNTKEYRAVVLSGPFMILYAKQIAKDFHIPVIEDIHGAFEDMVELSKKSSLLKGMLFRFTYHLEKSLINRNKKYVNGYFVVTDAMKEYIRKEFKTSEDAHFFIIPCATNVVPSNNRDYLNDRTKYRKKYKIDDDEKVFIYSGGVAPWQCVEKTITIYKQLADKLENKSRLLMFSHLKEDIIKFIGDDRRIQIDSYSPEELMHVLHVGDFAFLIRENNITNNVAFPNKYLEYIQSGMKIITTPYVKEIAKQVHDNCVGYIYDFDSSIEELANYVKNTDVNSYREEEIRMILDKNSFTNTTQSFCKWFFSEN